MFPQKPAGDHPAAAGDLPARPTESFAMPAKRPILPAGKANASGACMMSKSAKIYSTLALVLIGFPLFLALWSGTSAIMAILLIGAGASIVAVCLLVASFWHRYFRRSEARRVGQEWFRTGRSRGSAVH